MRNKLFKSDFKTFKFGGRSIWIQKTHFSCFSFNFLRTFDGNFFRFLLGSNSPFISNFAGSTCREKKTNLSDSKFEKIAEYLDRFSFDDAFVQNLTRQIDGFNLEKLI